MSASDDISCKQLFAYPDVVGELLCIVWPHAVRGAFKLQRCNCSYVSPAGTQRHGDMVWRVQRFPAPPVYLLLEFQSHADHWMALRMQVYAGLLCQDLLRQQRVRDGWLPLLLPVVLYTGAAPWTASTELGVLQNALPPELEGLQPEQKYVLLDQRQMRSAPERSVLSSLLEIEQISGETDLLFALQHITGWLAGKRNTELKHFMRDWILHRLRHGFRSLSIPEEISLLEVHAMFHQRFDTPEDLWKYQAEQRGLKEGMEQGMEQGVKAGMLAERRRLLMRLLHRAGAAAYPEQAVQAAEAGQLEAWIDQLLDGEIPGQLK